MDEWFSWLPASVLALGYFLAVLCIALILQAILLRLVNHRSQKGPFGLRMLFLRTKTLAQFAFVIFAAAVALPLLALDPTLEAAVRRVLAASVIVLLGWGAVIAVEIGADRYVGKFRIDADDNLLARSAVTQLKVLRRVFTSLVVVVTVALALMTFPSVRQYGISLFASAGVIGIVVGLAAQPTIGNLLAGVQLALTQPIRIDDVVIVQGEWGRIEEINSTYIVVRIWDLRRLVVPLSYFLQQPFENWTRTSAKILGSIFFYVDYTAPVDVIRAKLDELVKDSNLWDGDVLSVQVTDCKETTMEVRALISASDSSKAWDLRCLIREKMLAFLQKEYPEALPRGRGAFAVTLQNRDAENKEAPPAGSASPI